MKKRIFALLLSLIMCGTMVFGGMGSVFADGDAQEAAKSEAVKQAQPAQSVATQNDAQQNQEAVAAPRIEADPDRRPAPEGSARAKREESERHDAKASKDAAQAKEEKQREDTEQQKSAKSKKGVTSESLSPTASPNSEWTPPENTIPIDYSGAGSFSTSGAIGSGDNVTGSFNDGDDDLVTFDFYGFVYSITLQADKWYTINYESDDFDCYLYLINSDGNLIDTDDDRGVSLNSKIRYKSAGGGTYYLIATSFDGRGDEDGWASSMGGEYSLSISDSNGSITGTVTAPSGAPLGNIHAVAFKAEFYSNNGDTWWGWEEYEAVLTAADGTYGFFGMEEGEYLVQFIDYFDAEYISEYYKDSGRAYWSSAATRIVLNGESMSRTDVDRQLQIGGSISGKVTGNSSPLPYVEVYVQISADDDYYWNYSYTDENGDYIISGLPAGEYTVEFYPNSGGYLWTPYDSPVHVDMGVNTPDINIDISRRESGGTISGKVLNASGIALSGVSVTAYRWVDGSGGGGTEPPTEPGTDPDTGGGETGDGDGAEPPSGGGTEPPNPPTTDPPNPPDTTNPTNPPDINPSGDAPPQPTQAAADTIQPPVASPTGWWSPVANTTTGSGDTLGEYSLTGLDADVEYRIGYTDDSGVYRSCYYTEEGAVDTAYEALGIVLHDGETVTLADIILQPDVFITGTVTTDSAVDIYSIWINAEYYNNEDEYWQTGGQTYYNGAANGQFRIRGLREGVGYRLTVQYEVRIDAYNTKYFYGYVDENGNISNDGSEAQIHVIPPGGTISGLPIHIAPPVQDVPQDAQPLTSGSTASAVIGSGGDKAWFSFTPDADGWYIFESMNGDDGYGTQGILYGSEMIEVVSEYGYGTDGFRILRKLEGGNTYYYSAAYTDEGKTGNYTVALKAADGSISGHVENSSGNAVRNVYIEAYYLAGSYSGNWKYEYGIYAYTDEEGNYTMVGLDTQKTYMLRFNYWYEIDGIRYLSGYYAGAGQLLARTSEEAARIDFSEGSAVSGANAIMQRSASITMSFEDESGHDASNVGFDIYVWHESDDVTGGSWQIDYGRSSSSFFDGTRTVYTVSDLDPEQQYRLRVSSYSGEFISGYYSANGLTQNIDDADTLAYQPGSYEISLGTLTLYPSRFIRGVLTGEDGQPISGSEVCVWTQYYGYWAPNRNTYSRYDGSYVIYDLEEDIDYRIEFRGNDDCLGGFYTSGGMLAEDVTGADSVRAGVSAAASYDAVLHAAAKVSGRVRDDRGGVTGARVSIHGEGSYSDAYADADGYYTIGRLRPGTYTLYYYGDVRHFLGYRTASGAVSGDEQDAALITISDDGQIVQDIDVLAERGSTISGHVTDEYGNAVTGGYVYAESGNGSPSANINGEYVIGPLRTDVSYALRFAGSYSGSYIGGYWFDGGLAAANAADTFSFTEADDREDIDATLYQSMADPEVTWPTLQEITYGQTLAEAITSSGSAIGRNGEALEGKFEIAGLGNVYGASDGTRDIAVTFRPRDVSHRTGSTTLALKVNKANPVVSEWPTTERTLYHTGLTLGDIELGGGEASIQGVFSWQTPETALDVPGGSYPVVFAPTDSANYNSVTGSVAAEVFSVPPPAVIFGVSAVEDETGITVSWGIAEEVSTTVYKVYRRAVTDPPADFDLVQTVSGRDTQSWRDTEVVKGTVYEYYVVGVDQYGQEGPPSNMPRASLIDDAEAPIITQMLPSEGMKLSGIREFVLSVSDNVQAVSASIQYSTDGGVHWNPVMAESLAPSGTSGGTATFAAEFDTASVSDGALRVSAFAVDAAGNRSVSAQRTYLVDNTGPSQVTGVTGTAFSTTVTLGWEDVADDDRSYFRVERRTGAGDYVTEKDVSALGTAITGLVPGTSYTWRVVPYDDVGNRGIPSEDITIVTEGDTQPPVISNISPMPGYFNQDFSVGVTAEDNYIVSSVKIQISTDAAVWTDIDTQEYSDGGNVRTFEAIVRIANLPDGPIYVRGVAEDASGNISYTSGDAPFTQHIIDRTAPSAPSGVEAFGVNSSIEISWVAPDGDAIASYSVYRAASADDEFQLMRHGNAALNWFDTVVDDDVVYYYRVKAVDMAGNESDFSEIAAGQTEADSNAPTISEPYPPNGSVIGGTENVVSLTFMDDRRLDYYEVQYSRNGGEYRTLASEGALRSAYAGITAALPLAEFESGDAVSLLAVCKDKAGQWAEAKAFLYIVDLTAPLAANAAAAFDTDHAVISWTGYGESDLAGYNVYRKDSENGGYIYVAHVPAEDGRTEYLYEDSAIPKSAGTSIYRIDAIDAVGNASSRQTAGLALPERDAPTAVLSCDSVLEVGVEYVIDASMSYDNGGIVSYSIDFGDGSDVAATNSAIHKYTATGTYTVSLTVTDEDGLTGSATQVVEVKERTVLGTARIYVKSDSGAALTDALVYFDLGGTKQSVKKTNGSGYIDFTAEAGLYRTGAVIPDNQWLPATGYVNVAAGDVTDLTLILVNKPLVEGRLETHRMTLDEIEAAGIDTSDPANQHIVKFDVYLKYGFDALPIYYNETTDEIVEGGSFTHGGYRYIPTVIPGHGGGGSGDGSGGGSGGKSYAVGYLVLPVEVSALKDFFRIDLEIINNALPQFKMIDNAITLNVPEGLTLMDGLAGFSGRNVYLSEIAGQEQATISWVLRGDEIGTYPIHADYGGTLSEFDVPISARFSAEDGIKVEALTDVEARVEVPERMSQSGSSQGDGKYLFNLSLVNNSDREIYLPDIKIREVDKDSEEYRNNIVLDTKLFLSEHFDAEGTDISDTGAAINYIIEGVSTAYEGKWRVLKPGEKITQHYRQSEDDPRKIEGDLQEYFYRMLTESYGLEVNIIPRSWEYFEAYTVLKGELTDSLDWSYGIFSKDLKIFGKTISAAESGTTRASGPLPENLGTGAPWLTLPVPYNHIRVEADDLNVQDATGIVPGSAFSGYTAVSEAAIARSEHSEAYPDSIMGGAFSGCTALKKTTVPGDILGADIFSGCTGINELTLIKGVVTKEMTAYFAPFKDALKTLTVRGAGIGGYAFLEFTSLEQATIQSDIGPDAFYGCTALKSIDVTGDIGGFAFEGCTALDEAVISGSIGEYSFMGCENLKSVVLNNVDSIGDHAFSGCDSLSELFDYGWATVYADDILGDLPEDESLVLHCRHMSSAETFAVSYNQSHFNNVKVDYVDAQPKINPFDTSAPIPKDLPFIGDMSFGMDFDAIGIEYEVYGDHFKIGIGISPEAFEGENWNLFTKSLENLKKGFTQEEILKRFQTRHSATYGAKVKGDIRVWGYAEGHFGKNGPEIDEGKMAITLDLGVEQEWQYVFYVVPVVVKLSVEADMEASFPVKYENGEIKTDAEIELVLPKIRGSAGIGVAYVADASVYGQGLNRWKFDTTGLKEAVLEAEIGLTSHVLFFEGDDGPLLYGGIQWHPEFRSWGGGWFADLFGGGGSRSGTAPAAVPEGDYSIDVSGMNRGTAGAKSSKAAEREGGLSAKDDGTDSSEMYIGVFNNAKPQVAVADNGLKMMVWADTVPSRSIGNHTAIMYSVSQPGSKEWSEPAILEDDGTADFKPSVSASGNDIYVAWMDSNRNDFTENVTLEELAASCEISVAKYSAGSNTVATVNMLTDNGIADMTPKVSADAGGCSIAWIESGSNNIAANEGTGKIMGAYYQGNSGTVCSTLDSFTGKMLSNLAVGRLGSDVYAAYSFDPDADVEGTPEDSELFLASVSPAGSPISAATGRHNMWDMQFAEIGGTSKLLWNEGTSIYQLYSSDSEPEALAENLGAISRFTVINGADGDLLAYPAYADDAGDDNENGDMMLLKGIVLNGEQAAKPITLTEEMDGSVNSLAGYFEGGSYKFIYALGRVEMDENSISEHTSIDITPEIKQRSSLEIDHAVFDIDQTVAPGKTANLSVVVKNTGFTDEAGFTLRVNNRSGSLIAEKPIDTAIPIGESETVSISVPIPLDATAGEEYEVQAITASGEIGSRTFSLPQPDIQLKVEQDDSSGYTSLAAIVTNLSGFGTDCSIVIRAGSKNGEILSEYPLGYIAGRGSKTLPLPPAEVAKLGSPGEILYIEAVAPSEEYTSDNSATVIVAGDAQHFNVRSIAITGAPALFAYNPGAQSNFLQLGTEILPQDAANKAVTWASSDEGIATVSSTGLVTFKGNTGSVTIKATASDGSGVFGTATIVVMMKPDGGGGTQGDTLVKMSSVTINGAPATFAFKAGGQGNTLLLSAAVAPASATRKDLVWSSSNNNVATVDGSGLVTFTGGEGDVTITASSSDGSGVSSSVVIRAVKNVTSIRTPMSKVYIQAGKSLVLPVVLDDNTKPGAEISSALTWKSSNARALTVDARGNVKASKSVKKNTKANVIVTSANGKTLTITVYAVPKAIKLKRVTAKFPKTMKNGTFYQLKPKLSAVNATGVKVTFKSSKPNTIRVDKAGKLYALKKGKATITVIAGKKKTKFTIKVV
ncbi:MAG: Ig-like domain-containing protein [Clostridiales Family XIII bacterium]|nr:Ig-like domain-containing protein [Clostridiales Family XIII bacterium]